MRLAGPATRGCSTLRLPATNPRVRDPDRHANLKNPSEVRESLDAPGDLWFSSATDRR